MLTSPNGKIFRVIGHLCGEFTGHRWIPRTKASDAELWSFLWSAPNKRLSKQSWGWWFETLSRHDDVTVMPPLSWARVRFSIKMPSFQYRRYHFRKKMILWQLISIMVSHTGKRFILKRAQTIYYYSTADRTDWHVAVEFGIGMVRFA